MPSGREAVCSWEEGRIYSFQYRHNFDRVLMVVPQRTVNAKQLMDKHLR